MSKKDRHFKLVGVLFVACLAAAATAKPTQQPSVADFLVERKLQGASLAIASCDKAPAQVRQQFRAALSAYEKRLRRVAQAMASEPSRAQLKLNPNEVAMDRLERELRESKSPAALKRTLSSTECQTLAANLGFESEGRIYVQLNEGFRRFGRLKG